MSGWRREAGSCPGPATSFLGLSQTGTFQDPLRPLQTPPAAARRSFFGLRALGQGQPSLVLAVGEAKETALPHKVRPCTLSAVAA